MSSTGARKPHAVCVPFPAQGHVTPLMHLAKLLHSRGFHITFVNTEFNHRRLIRSRGPDSVEGLPDFRFETIPDGLPLPPSDFDATQDVPSLCDSTRKNCLAPFKELLTKLNSSSEVPPVTCVISDGAMSFGIKAAEEFNIPQVQFWTASACSFMGYLHFSELTRRGFVPYKGVYFLPFLRLSVLYYPRRRMQHAFLDISLLFEKMFIKDIKLYPSVVSEENLLRDGDTPIDWIPGLSNIRLKDMPTFTRTTNDEIMFDFMGSEAENCLNSPAIIFNTFNEFENEVLESIIATKFPNIYTIGPLPLLAKHIPAESESRSLGSSLWKEDSNCLDWLDKRGLNSVVYINYGSVTVMTDTHLREFAWGLANSKLPFLWIIRPDVVMGDSAVLPEEFLEQIDGRGLLASWCPQDQVLAHPSVGVFLTHCGWNSMMETISCGVPVICWPFFADQQPNCRYACTKWGIGVEVNHDVKRNEIESLVKEMIEGDSGKQMRQKALEWKDIAEAATNIGGSSYNDFEKFIKEALFCV